MCLINSSTSIIAGFVVFSVLGYMANSIGKRIDDVVKGGVGLAFLVYPEAIITLPASQVWSVLFFLMIMILGLDSQVKLFLITPNGLWPDLFLGLHGGRRHHGDVRSVSHFTTKQEEIRGRFVRCKLYIGFDYGHASKLLADFLKFWLTNSILGRTILVEANRQFWCQWHYAAFCHVFRSGRFVVGFR